MNLSKIKTIQKGAAALVLVLAAGLLWTGCSGNPSGSNRNTSSGEVFADKTIRVGYISYPPGFIVDPNTKEKSGIFNEVLTEVARRNNLTVDYKEEVTWATMIESLKTNRVDLIANPVWATKERKENADFSTPVYFSPIGIYVRSDDSRFDSDISKLNDPSVRIAAVDGEINFTIGKQDFPKAQVAPLPNNIDVAQLFLEIQTKKKDVTFAEPLFAFDYMKKNPGKIKNIAEQSPIRNYPNSFMFKKGAQKTQTFLNAEIDKLIKDGTVDRIVAKYEPFSGAVIRVGDPRAVDKQ